MSEELITISRTTELAAGGLVPHAVTVRLPDSVERVTELVVRFFAPDNPPDADRPSHATNGMILQSDDGETLFYLDRTRPSVTLRAAENPMLLVSADLLSERPMAASGMGLDEQSELFDIDVIVPASRADRVLITAACDRWGPLLRQFAEHPERMREMDPRAFEEFVAELLRRDGMDVTLTPATRDGGRDVLARAETTLGSHLYLVETKRYGEAHKVGVAIVERLYGVVQRERATAGLIVTTSSFTQPARQAQQQLQHQMSLTDFEKLTTWVRATERA